MAPLTPVQSLISAWGFPLAEASIVSRHMGRKRSSPELLQISSDSQVPTVAQDPHFTEARICQPEPTRDFLSLSLANIHVFFPHHLLHQVPAHSLPERVFPPPSQSARLSFSHRDFLPSLLSFSYRYCFLPRPRGVFWMPEEILDYDTQAHGLTFVPVSAHHV